ncbi:MAG TPA: indole-3-glycerol phosphate synthase TrpC [Polyangia bacterium]
MAKKREAHAARRPVSLDALWEEVARLEPARPFSEALRDQRRAAPRVIAEFKRRSPSAGEIRPGAEPAEIARAYAGAGAAALSVLTDEEFFGGAPNDLIVAKEATSLPVLRKDFLLDERDLLESRRIGADAILLIVRLLPPGELRALLSVARRAGLDALVEAHGDRELEVALAAGASLLGVNHRDLDTLTIDLSLSRRARAIAGPEPILVAESGLHSRADLERMREHGADAVLIGESLLRAPSPGAALAELCG